MAQVFAVILLKVAQVHFSIHRRGFLTEWQMEAIDYMLNNAPERDVDDAEIEPVMINGMEIDVSPVRK